MLRLNPLPRKVLITTDEVIAMCPTDNTVSPDNLLQAIIIAEERFVKKLMCPDFYYAMRDEKNTVVTEVNKSFLETQVNIGNTGEAITLDVGDKINGIELVTNEKYKEWWYEFGWKIAAECVLYVATPTNWVRYSTQGEMMNSPKTITNEGSGAASAELKDIKWKMDKLLMDRIDPLIEAHHEWMCSSRAGIAEYNCKDCGGGCGPGRSSDGVSYQRKTGWIHNIYDHGNNGCCD